MKDHEVKDHWRQGYFKSTYFSNPNLENKLDSEGQQNDSNSKDFKGKMTFQFKGNKKNWKATKQRRKNQLRSDNPFSSHRYK